MNRQWTLNPDYASTACAAHFDTLDKVFALEGERIAKDPLSQVIRVEVAGRRFYVKRYTAAAKNPLRRWLARPRVKAEWENLLAFDRWGIPTAPVVAYGLERKLGGFVRGALITEELTNTEDLARLAKVDDKRLHNRKWVASVSRQVAHITRTMHANGFTHNDLKWRNLLVDTHTPPRVFLIDCPGGMFWPEPFLSYRIVKDLACLDKVAKYQLSRTQRLRFYLDYAGHRRLTEGDKARIGAILRFFKGRE